MTFGSLFTGIGGLDLGLERAGMECKWQVEKDDYAIKVLERHWPTTPRYRDVSTFPPPGGCEYVDLIAGGFPCQPVSVAGLGRQAADERWLWPEFARILRLLRPKFALLENVPGLFVRGFLGVLSDLADIGFDAEWSTISACALGAAHPRNRLFVVAYAPSSLGRTGLRLRELAETRTVQRVNDLSAPVLRLESAHRNGLPFNGLSKRVGLEFRAYGNAVVPHVAEWIGRRLMETVK